MRDDRAMSRPSRRSGLFARAIHVFIAVLVALSGIASVLAQPVPNGLLAPGDAVVTGFSGAIPPAQIAPGINPVGWIFIDLNGPSLRVVDLQNLGAAPNAQLVNAPKRFTITAGQVGQVFAVA